jgi:hypothetical protein
MKFYSKKFTFKELDEALKNCKTKEERLAAFLKIATERR